MAEINRYNNSKIYKICSNLTDKIYIGSTTQTLSQRLSEHVKNYKTHIKNNNTKYVSSYEIIKYGDFYITLIEECNYNNRQQLFKREGEFIKLNINNAVNMLIAGRTQKEYVIINKEHITEYQKKYRLNNAVEIKQYRIDNQEKIKQYYNDNKEIIAEKSKQYYNDNKEIIAENYKQYYNDNLAEKNKQTFTCNCGSILRFRDKLRHYKTKKHIIEISFLNELTFYNL